jgi:tricorn protease-like protein
MKPGIELKIANTEEAAFLLQAELHSIYRGNIYVSERKGVWDEKAYTMRGYFDQKNNVDGPVIVLFDDGEIWLVDYTKSNTHLI